jgi:hypothetical protein
MNWARRIVVDVVVFDPEGYDTYPSVCAEPSTVKDRFGYTGGELLVFDYRTGTFLGRLVNFWSEGVGWDTTTTTT